MSKKITNESLWGQRLINLRRRDHLTQQHLADVLGVDVMSVSRWERGVVTPSKRIQGKLKDLVLHYKNPLSLPFIKRVLSTHRFAYVLDFPKDTFLHIQNPDHSFDLDQGMLGKSVKHILSPYMIEEAENIGGPPGALEKGLVSYTLVHETAVKGGRKLVQVDSDVIRMDGYTAISIVSRRVIKDLSGSTEAPKLISLEKVFEDDIFGGDT